MLGLSPIFFTVHLLDCAAFGQAHRGLCEALPVLARAVTPGSFSSELSNSCFFRHSRFPFLPLLPAPWGGGSVAPQSLLPAVWVISFPRCLQPSSLLSARTELSQLSSVHLLWGVLGSSKSIHKHKVHLLHSNLPPGAHSFHFSALPEKCICPGRRSENLFYTLITLHLLPTQIWSASDSCQKFYIFRYMSFSLLSVPLLLSKHSSPKLHYFDIQLMGFFSFFLFLFFSLPIFSFITLWKVKIWSCHSLIQIIYKYSFYCTRSPATVKFSAYL